MKPMSKSIKSIHLFNPRYDTDDMAIIKERRLKWNNSYLKPQTQLQNTLSRIAIIAESERKRLLKSEF